eukprot:5217638-Prorocentrum_lima.AAC.1
MNHSVEGATRPPRGSGPAEYRGSSSSDRYYGPRLASGTPVPIVPPAPQCPDCNSQIIQIDGAAQLGGL